MDTVDLKQILHRGNRRKMEPDKQNVGIFHGNPDGRSTKGSQKQSWG